MPNKYTALRRYQKAVGKPCPYCRRIMDSTSPLLMPTKDHVEPHSRGGLMTVWACSDCNNRKSDLTLAEWQAFMATHPRWWCTPLRPVRPLRMRPANRVNVIGGVLQIAEIRPSPGPHGSKNGLAVIPYEESIMILKCGKKAWREWKAAQAAQ